MKLIKYHQQYTRKKYYYKLQAVKLIKNITLENVEFDSAWKALCASVNRSAKTTENSERHTTHFRLEEKKYRNTRAIHLVCLRIYY
jgi:hypothetical protein